MAEQRPYRLPGFSVDARLARAKRLALLSLVGAFLAINWVTTQHVASVLTDASWLGHPLFRIKSGAVYAPWSWINPSQEALIVRWMSQYKDAPRKSHSMIDVGAYGPDPEAVHLAEQVLEAFRQSGCRVGPAQAGAFGIAPLGIVVEYQPAEKDNPPWKGNQWAIIAAGIVNTLKHAGLFVLPPEPFKYADPRTAHLDAPLSVIIGKR